MPSTSIAPEAHLADEFTHALETERGRWLRRRFQWWCVLTVFLGLSTFAGEDRIALKAVRGDAPMPPTAGVLLLVQYALMLSLNAAALIYLWRRDPPRQTLLRLATGLVIIGAAADLLILRLILQVHPQYMEHEAGASGALTWAIAAPTILVMYFTLVCLFIPWTKSEAIRPAAALAAVGSVILLRDVLAGNLSPWGALALLLLPLSVSPGVLICWWRYSRFRRKFRIRFESLAYRALVGELNSARRILDACLPPRRSTGPLRLEYVYEPMRQIGGDMLFVHPADDEQSPCASVILFDVTGHGIPAALIVNRLVGELQRLFAEDDSASPGDVLRGLNRYVSLTLSPHGLFVTALCLRVDAEADRIQWASAGHPPAFVVRRGRPPEAVESTTVPLGVIGDDFDPEMAEMPFGPGDALVLYTDGVIEARDPAGRPVGVAGLVDLLRNLPPHPAEWPGLLLRRLIAHRSAPPDDDTVIAVLHRP